MISGLPNQPAAQQQEGRQQQQQQQKKKTISFLNELVERNSIGNVCVRINSASSPLISRNGWHYRRLSVEDSSMKADLLLSEEKLAQVIGLGAGGRIPSVDSANPCFAYCAVRSNGVDNDGKLTLFLNFALPASEAAKALYATVSELSEAKQKTYDRMETQETVYQLSAREVHSLIQLINLWLKEKGKPQHYNKWCQMHQIVATELFYMGMVSRIGAMTGYYHPTKRALEFFAGELKIPKKRIFVKDEMGRHRLVSEQGETKTLSDYLQDYANRETAIQEYKEAMQSFHQTVGARGAADFYASVPESEDFADFTL
jgi:hypothetical protein